MVSIISSCLFISPDSSPNTRHQCHLAPVVTTQKSLEAARHRKKALHTSSTQPQTLSESTLLCVPTTSDTPALEFPSSPTPIAPPSDDEEFPDSIAVSVQITHQTKQKSEVILDISDADLTAPTKNKPGQMPKVQPVKSRKARERTHTYQSYYPEDFESDEDEIEIVTPAVLPKSESREIVASEYSKNEQRIYIPRIKYKNRRNNPEVEKFWRLGYGRGFVVPNNVRLGISKNQTVESATKTGMNPRLEVNMWWLKTFSSHCGAFVMGERKDVQNTVKWRRDKAGGKYRYF
ncbi:hypothetical protein K438DRAFT_1783765 [Mycena galopus ATCC 62051]|nr:hypothetical protein K438DRAFT_1783765 [Mycena galopus ATCC 62051]